MITRIRSSKKIQNMAQRDTSAPLASQLAGIEIQRDEFADIRSIDVNDIRPDPDQHRHLDVTLDILANPETVRDERIRENALGIIGLGKSLRELGQQELIEVYRDGALYRLVKGERRWWAAQIAGIPSLRAKVLDVRPERVRLRQFVENVQRQGLSQEEMQTAVEAVVAEAKTQGLKLMTAEDLENLTGLTRRVAARWWRLISQRPDVGQAVRDGLLARAGDIDAALRAEPGELANVIQAAAEGSKQAPKDAALQGTILSVSEKPKHRQKRAGRPRVFRLSVTDSRVVRVLLERMGLDIEIIQWDDHEAVQKALTGAILEIEKRIKAAG